MSIYIFLFLISDKKTSKCSSCQWHLFEGEVKMVLNKYVPEVNSILNRPLNQKKKGGEKKEKKRPMQVQLQKMLLFTPTRVYQVCWFRFCIRVRLIPGNAHRGRDDEQRLLLRKGFSESRRESLTSGGRCARGPVMKRRRLMGKSGDGFGSSQWKRLVYGAQQLKRRDKRLPRLSSHLHVNLLLFSPPGWFSGARDTLTRPLRGVN